MKSILEYLITGHIKSNNNYDITFGEIINWSIMNDKDKRPDSSYFDIILDIITDDKIPNNNLIGKFKDHSDLWEFYRINYNEKIKNVSCEKINIDGYPYLISFTVTCIKCNKDFDFKIPVKNNIDKFN